MRRDRKMLAPGFLVLALGFAGLQCAPTSVPATSVPANAPQSVKNAKSCVPNRAGQTYVLVGSGGQGWWVVDTNGNYFGWLETRESGCPNDTWLEWTVVYARG